MLGAGFKPVGELHSQPSDSAFAAERLRLPARGAAVVLRVAVQLCTVVEMYLLVLCDMLCDMLLLLCCVCVVCEATACAPDA